MDQHFVWLLALVATVVAAIWVMHAVAAIGAL